MISLRDSLNIMRAVDQNDEPIPFSLKAVEFNEQLDKGGEFLEVDRAILPRTGKKSVKSNRLEPLMEHEKLRKNPNHFENLTINIMLMPSRNIRKIHIHLITRINGERLF